MPIDTRLKNTASKARSLLTGLSKANKISSRATAQISKKQFGSDMEAPQQLVRHDVDGCGRCVARYDQPVPDECLTEEAHDNDDQVQHAADSCVKLWRLFNRTSCHFGSPELYNRNQACLRLRSVPDSGAAGPLRRGMPRRLPSRSTDPGCSGNDPESGVSSDPSGRYPVL